MYKHIRIALYMLLLFCFSNTYAQEWELKKSKKNIDIYNRTIDSLPFKEFKASCSIKTTLKKAISFITNGDNLWEWNDKTTESKLIKKINEKEFVVWMKNEFSWPVKDRDNISHLKIIQLDSISYKIQITPETEIKVPEKKGIIRLKHFYGFWHIQKQDHAVIITQQMYGNPKSNFPSWVLDGVITNTMYKTFESLRKKLEK